MKKKLKSTLTGKVVSDRMANSVVVEVERWVVHPIYKKRHKIHKNYHADNSFGAKSGDTVVLESTRPLSKTKRWRVDRVI